jgi:hypothetical protein
VLRSHRLAFLVGVFFCCERTRTRNPNKFIVVSVPLYDNPTGMPHLLTLLGGHGEEGRPPLLYLLASALRANIFTLLDSEIVRIFETSSLQARQRKLYWGMTSSPT